MTSISEYTFNNIGRIGADKNDNSQRNLSNTKHLNYSLANHYSANSSDSHVKFATSNLGISYKNSLGGLPGNMVDFDSSLSIKKDSDRHFEKDVAHGCNDHYCSGIFRAIGHRTVDRFGQHAIFGKTWSVRRFR